MATTKIEWTDAVWNSVTGCTPVSEGCAHCYAQRMAQRLAGRYGYPADEPFRVTLHPERLDEPLRWRKARRVFVCSMGDLFYPFVPLRFVEKLWAVMARTPQHRFLLLTKRPNRMAEAVRAVRGWWNCAGGVFLPQHPRLEVEWPLPNVWLGVTAENQARADERIPILLQTPAAHRFVSVEPLLESVYLSPWLATYVPLKRTTPSGKTLFRCRCGHETPAPCRPPYHPCGKLDWVIAGCESGPKRRPAQTDWLRDLRDQCIAAGVPFFLKQMDVDGKVVKMPALDGQVWAQQPEWSAT